MLSQSRKDFGVDSVKEEKILAHSESKRKYFKFEILGQIEFFLQKSRITGPWDHGYLVFEKKEKNLMLVYL